MADGGLQQIFLKLCAGIYGGRRLPLQHVLPSIPSNKLSCWCIMYDTTQAALPSNPQVLVGGRTTPATDLGIVGIVTAVPSILPNAGSRVQAHIPKTAFVSDTSNMPEHFIGKYSGLCIMPLLPLPVAKLQSWTPLRGSTYLFKGSGSKDRAWCMDFGTRESSNREHTHPLGYINRPSLSEARRHMGLAGPGLISTEK